MHTLIAHLAMDTYNNTPAPGYGNLLPATSGIHASTFGALFFLFWAGLLVVVLALPWATVRLVKHRDPLPWLALLSGLGTCIGEPMLDHVGHLRWSEHLIVPTAFHNFGLAIPALIPPCYMLFMGLESYWVYTIIQKGITKKNLLLMMAACGLTDAIMETPGLMLKAYEYYGNQPFKFYKFPFYWSFTNAAAIVAIGVVLHFVWPRVKGRGIKQLWVIPIGLIATTFAEFGTGFPVFLSINANIPTWLQWVLSLGTVVLAPYFVSLMGDLVCSHDSRLKWTFWGFFKARFMTPGQRAKYYEQIGWTAEIKPPSSEWPPVRWIERPADSRESVRI